VEPDQERVIGTSVRGLPITARHVGAPDAPVQLVVIGQMHGNEPGGRKVVDALLGGPVPEGVGLWIVRTMNPDGNGQGRRTNARGTDLNRNFPTNWRRAGRGMGEWSGRRTRS
jgi:murein tripeptide amidase MpaA